MGLHMAQQIKPAAARHANVRDQYLRFLTVVERRQGFVRRAEALGRNVLAAERLFQHPADGAIVVDDPDGVHGLPLGRAKADPRLARACSELWSSRLRQKGLGNTSFISLPFSFGSPAASAKHRG